MIKKILFLCLLACSLMLCCSIFAAPKTNTSQKHPGTNNMSKTANNVTCKKIKRCNKQGKQCKYVMQCERSYSTSGQLNQEYQSIQQQAASVLGSITPTQTSALQERIKKEKALEKDQFAINLFNPNYILPFYYTGSPYDQIYRGNTPDNQSIKKTEFKAQLSFKIPLLKHLFSDRRSFNFAFTQLFYWQLYTESPYFRETNYMPEFFISDNFLRNWLLNVGAVHQSNGRGGRLERSWNRVYFDLRFSGNHWMISLKPWLLIFTNESSNLHNPDIEHYLGYGRVLVAYKCRDQVVSLMFRNVVFSGFKRGTVEVTYSFPLHGRIKGYIQGFSGYGQSLIEYNHRTNSVGVGIAINDWI